MSPDAQWEASQIAASLTTYIVGIEDIIKRPMVEAVAHLMLQVDAVFETLRPMVDAAMEHGSVNLPWDEEAYAS